MNKILLGSEKASFFESYFQCLKTQIDIDLSIAKTGKETIKKCRTINPAIIILHTQFSDMLFTDIIKKIGELKNEDAKSNLILILDNQNDKTYLEDVSVIHKIFTYPFEFEKLTETIMYLRMKYSNTSITFDDITDIIDTLGFGINKPGTKYIISAIHNMYYMKDSLLPINKIYEIVANEFDTCSSKVKSSIRYAIESNYFSKNEFCKKNYQIIFGTSYKLSNKIFLETFLNYLYMEKVRNK